MEDLSEAKKYPHTSPLAYSNTGMLYFKQGLYDRAEDHLVQAIESQPDLALAYYNLGILYDKEGDKERAKTLFENAIYFDRNYKEAREALEKIQQPGLKDIRDWFNWWFDPNAPGIKKVTGAVLLIISIFLILTSTIYSIKKESLPNSFFYTIGITILILILSSITKLKAGPLELEMESQGKIPTL
jgi:tetratricopeptide (TPR) repeat protein